MRLVFLGSPPFATPILERLLASDHDVASVVTPPDRPRGRGRALVPSELALRAEAAGLAVLRPATTKDPAFVASLAAFEPLVLVVASYGEILRRDVLELCPHGALNVHASLLPRWRGASPIQRAIAAGDETTGVTIQRMVLALDAGDILLARETPIRPSETAAALFDRLAVLGGEAIVEALDSLAAGTATFRRQDEAGVTLAPKLEKDDGRIDFSRGTIGVERHVRAMTTWPGARTRLPDGRDLVVLEVEAVEATQPAAEPGTLLDADLGVVATGSGAVRLKRVQPAGKRAMDGRDFFRGARLEAGSRFD